MHTTQSSQPAQAEHKQQSSYRVDGGPMLGKDLVSSLCSGLLTIGPRFGGALDDAARMLLSQHSHAGISLTWDHHLRSVFWFRFADAQGSGVAPKAGWPRPPISFLLSTLLAGLDREDEEEQPAHPDQRVGARVQSHNGSCTKWRARWRSSRVSPRRTSTLRPFLTTPSQSKLG